MFWHRVGSCARSTAVIGFSTMDIKAAVPILESLRPQETRVIYTVTGGIEVIATRTDKISEHDFAVGLRIPDTPEFRPTHVRLLIDLHLKCLSDPKDARVLLDAFESVYHGDDPLSVTGQFAHVKFPMQLDRADVNLLYAQLLMVEQDFNYGPGKKRSSFNPARGFLMAFIRWAGSQEDQIDKVITAAVRNYPPPRRFAR